MAPKSRPPTAPGIMRTDCLARGFWNIQTSESGATYNTIAIGDHLANRWKPSYSPSETPAEWLNPLYKRARSPITFNMDFHTLDDRHDAPGYRDLLGASSIRETSIQIVFSLALGISAFLGFCILRTRWPGLYAARKKHVDTGELPELPDTMFGWIAPLWRITDQQVLASAGLDAYAFLAFFKMAMKFCFITLI